MGLPFRRSAGLAAAGLTVFLLACTPRPEPPAKPAPATPAPAATPPILAPPPPLDRAGLLQAVAAAASTASGGEYPQAAADLSGKRFSLRLPFGCAGPGAEDAAARYSLDAKTQTLRLSVRPEAWSDEDWVRALVGSEDTEAIEGYWVRRPWRTTDDCPAPPVKLPAAQAPADEATAAKPAKGKGKAKSSAKAGKAPEAPATPPASPETVGLAQVFAEGGSRVMRRGDRPYEATKKLAEGETPPPGGFRLVLEGRIANPADRHPVRCRSQNPDRRPVCLVMIELDRVALQDATGAQLAEWRN